MSEINFQFEKTVFHWVKFLLACLTEGIGAGAVSLQLSGIFRRGNKVVAYNGKVFVLCRAWDLPGAVTP